MPANRLTPLPLIARVLGYAGLLPQAGVVVILMLGGPELRFAALSLGFAYAAVIFSFLGGVWWGLASAAHAAIPRWIWVAAVMPSLLALCAAWPWAVGKMWPGPSLICLGLLIMASVIVDLNLRNLDMAPRGWMSLRLPLSVGLGGLTLWAGLIS